MRTKEYAQTPVLAGGPDSSVPPVMIDPYCQKTKQSKKFKKKIKKGKND